MMNRVTRWMPAAVLLACPMWVQADCGGASPLFGAGFEASQPFTVVGDVVGLFKGTVEARVGADDAAVASATFSHGQSFSLEIPAVAPENVLRLHVRGQDEADHVELAAQVGDIAALDRAARANSGFITPTEFSSVVVTPESTARYALLAAANEGSTQIRPACRLAELQASLDEAAVEQRIAWIKFAIEDGGFGPPLRLTKGGPVSSTTLDLLLDPEAYAADITRIETEEPVRWSQMQALVAEPFCSYFQDDARLVFRLREVELNGLFAEHYRFDTPGSGVAVRSDGTDTFSASCDGTTARFEFAGNAGSVFYLYRLVDGVQTQVPARIITDWIELQRIDAGTSLVALFVRTSSRLTFVEHGHLFPDQITQGAGTSLALVRAAVGTPFDPANQPGEYVLPLADDMANRALRVRLEADGTGEVIADGTLLSWSVDAGGALDIALPDRDAHLVPYRNDGPVRDVFAHIDYHDGRSEVAVDFAPRRDPAAGVTLADLPGVLLQYGGRTGGSAFGFTLAADGTATVLSGARRYGWTLDSDSLTLRSCSMQPIHADPQPADGCNEHERREFHVFQRDGDFWYVYEDRESWYDYGSGLERVILQRLNRPYSRAPLDP